MSKRALTANQRAWLLEELSLWRRDAIVTDQQSQRIADLYEGAGEMAQRGRSKAVFILGCLFYGAGIWLVAQVLHISAHYPDGIWWWAVGVLPFALCLETRLLHALFVALMAFWAGQEVLGFGHLGGWLFGRWDFLPNGAYSLPLLALPGMVWAYRKQSVKT